MRPTFLAAVIGFALGIWLASAAGWGWVLPAWLATLASALLLCNLITRRGGLLQDRRVLVLASIFLFALATGSARFTLHEARVDRSLDQFVDQKVELTGLVTSAPDTRDDGTYLVFQPEGRRSAIRLRVALYPTFNQGDEVRVSGTLAWPENFAGDAGRTFNYIGYLARSDIRYKMSGPSVTLLSSGHVGWVESRLMALKQAFLAALARALPEPAASLAGGIVVGAKQSLGADLLEDFRRAGIIHLIVLSGSNITIVASSLARVFSFAPTLVGTIAGGIGVVAFSILAGGGSTVARAAIMALIALLGRSLGRNYNVTVALLIAGVLMLLENPTVLLWDTGFQLSFLSTLGLIKLSPTINYYLTWVPERAGLRGIVSTTLATQLFVLPWLLYQVGQLSIVALPVNVLVLPLIPLTMLLVAITGAVGLLSYYLSLPFAYLAYFFLAYTLTIARTTAHLPGAALTVPLFPLWVVGVSYVLIALWVRRTGAKLGESRVV